MHVKIKIIIVFKCTLNKILRSYRFCNKSRHIFVYFILTTHNNSNPSQILLRLFQLSIEIFRKILHQRYYKTTISSSEPRFYIRFRHMYYACTTYSTHNEWDCSYLSSETMIASIAASWLGPLANVRKDGPNGPIQSAKLRTSVRSSFVNGSYHWLLRVTVGFELGWSYSGYDTVSPLDCQPLRNSAPSFQAIKQFCALFPCSESSHELFIFHVLCKYD